MRGYDNGGTVKTVPYIYIVRYPFEGAEVALAIGDGCAIIRKNKP